MPILRAIAAPASEWKQGSEICRIMFEPHWTTFLFWSMVINWMVDWPEWHIVFVFVLFCVFVICMAGGLWIVCVISFQKVFGLIARQWSCYNFSWGRWGGWKICQGWQRWSLGWQGVTSIFLLKRRSSPSCRRLTSLMSLWSVKMAHWSRHTRRFSALEVISSEAFWWKTSIRVPWSTWGCLLNTCNLWFDLSSQESAMWNIIQGVFLFNWDPPKSSQCQNLVTGWH